jgi:hypothetical protein
VRAARELGCDLTLAVDLLPMGDSGRKVGNLFEIWHRSIYLMVRGNHPAGAEDCLTITPRIAGFSFTDFGEVPELVRCGEEAARAALPEILRRAERASSC